MGAKEFAVAPPYLLKVLRALPWVCGYRGHLALLESEHLDQMCQVLSKGAKPSLRRKLLLRRSRRCLRQVKVHGRARSL